MTKELEALKEARNFRHEKDEHLVVIDIDYFNKCLDGIETTLERLVELEDIFNEVKSGEAVVVSAEKNAALELIKKIIPIEEEDFFCDKEADIYFFLGRKVSKEQFDLLKEGLL